MPAVPRQPRSSLLLVACLALLIACHIDIAPLTIEWDQDPGTLIIEADTFGGLVPQTQALNHIPDARIWGDGRIVWVERHAGAGRNVWQSQLSHQALIKLASFIIEEGFFDWQTHYQPADPPPDLPTSHISVHLADRSKTVSQYFALQQAQDDGGAPAGFWRIYDAIKTVPEGEPLVPQRGWLRAWPQDANASADAARPWPVDAGVTLSEAAVAGRWIEEPLITLVWDALNRSGGHSSTRAVFQEEEKIYSLTLQIPGISLHEP